MITTFAPNGQNTAQLVASTTTARVAIDKNSAAVRVVNAGPNIAFLNFGDSTVTADNAKMPLPVGNTELFTKALATHVAAIVETGSATLYITSGEGI